jgi:hypothetical protein
MQQPANDNPGDQNPLHDVPAAGYQAIFMVGNKDRWAIFNNVLVDERPRLLIRTTVIAEMPNQQLLAEYEAQKQAAPKQKPRSDHLRII